MDHSYCSLFDLLKIMCAFMFFRCLSSVVDHENVIVEVFVKNPVECDAKLVSCHGLARHRWPVVRSAVPRAGTTRKIGFVLVPCLERDT
jgi:hypothetical protein